MTVDRIFKGIVISYALLVTGVAVATKIALRTDASGLSSIPLVLVTAPTSLVASPVYDAVLPPEGDQNLALAMVTATGYFQAGLLWLAGSRLAAWRRAAATRPPRP